MYMYMCGCACICTYTFFHTHIYVYIKVDMGFPKIWGAILGVPYNEECCILRSILRSPSSGKPPYPLGV